MTRRSLTRRSLYLQFWCIVLLLLLLVWRSSAAHAHASLISSNPANEAVLTVAPTALTLTFDEAVTPLVMRIVDKHGLAQDVSQVEQRAANLVVVPPNVLVPGAYILSWRVISSDGHPVGGSLIFWVGARSSPAPDIVSVESAPVRVGIWATRMAIYIGLFVGAGGAFFLAWMSPNTRMRDARVVVAAATLAGLLALVLSVGFQGLDALAAPLSALNAAAVWRAGARGSFGWSVLIAVIALSSGFFSLVSRGGIAKILAMAALLGVGLMLSVSGHAATVDARAIAIGAMTLHGASIAFWVGALTPLLFALRRRDRTMPLLKAFSRVVPFAVAALLASGLVLSILQLQHVAALWTTDYGRVLIAKLFLVALLLLFALWNRFSLTPGILANAERPARRMQKSILCELVLVAGILGVVGLWRFTPPPRLPLAVAQDNFFLHVHSEKVMANVTISPGGAGPVEIVVQLEAPDERPLTAMELSVTLSNPDLGIEPMTAQAQRMDNSQWRAHMTVSVAGRWMLRMGILISDFDKVDIEAPVLIK